MKDGSPPVKLLLPGSWGKDGVEVPGGFRHHGRVLFFE